MLTLTLDEELAALFRGDLVECLVCGGDVEAEGERIGCPTCGSVLERREVVPDQLSLA
jgi:Zn finger protein HypA/HybF involved in hydrogenase expression